MNQGLKSKLWDPFFKEGKNPLWTFQIPGSTWYLYEKNKAGRKKFNLWLMQFMHGLRHY